MEHGRSMEIDVGGYGTHGDGHLHAVGMDILVGKLDAFASAGCPASKEEDGQVIFVYRALRGRWGSCQKCFILRLGYLIVRRSQIDSLIPPWAKSAVSVRFKNGLPRANARQSASSKMCKISSAANR